MRPVLGFSADEWTAILLSLRVATVATVFALPFAIFAAYALARWRIPGKLFIDSVLHLPLVMPPVVTGYLLLLTFGRQGPIGSFLYDVFGITLSFRWTGAALACGVMGFPLMLRAIQLSFDTIDRRLETAAGTLGANHGWTFLLVTLPLALPGNHRRRHSVFCQGARRVRSDDNVRIQHPGRDADHSVGDLYLYAGSRRRDTSAAADIRLHRHRHGGSDRVRSFEPSCL